MRLAKKTALITGGNSGIGLSTARLFVADWRPCRHYRAEPENAGRGGCRTGHDVLAIQADVTNIEATERAVAKAVERFGKLDIVFANAGIPGATTVGETSLAAFEEIVGTNLTAVFLTVQAAAAFA
jgi:NAD(P)-dependent dehydrogenase (short-subunit alcohol dehydrogenase family)